MKKIKIFLSLLAIVSVLFGGFPQSTLALESGKVLEQKVDRSIAVNGLESYSEIERADFSFTGIATSWSSGFSDPQVYLRLGKEKDSLRDWFLVNGEDDSKDGSEGMVYGGIINSDKDLYYQYKVVFSPEDLGKEFKLRLSFFDTSRQSLGGTRIASDNSGLGPKIISRKEWGANEGYMKWEPEYGEVKAFVVHHTAGEEGTKVSQTEAVKGLYYGHAVSYGWGDVGYNYIIDINGNIYEGRAGGNSVIAGHTLGYNTGTIGISLIGDYNVRGIETAQYQALIDLIAYKSFQNGVDPSSTVYLKNKTIPTIVGHKDLNATQCPGTTIYERMNDLRIKVKDKLATYPAQSYGAQIVSFDNGVKLFGGDTQKVRFSAKNTGNAPWLAEGSKKLTISSLDSRFSASMVNFGRSIEPGEIGNFEVDLATPLINQTIGLGFQIKTGGSLISGGEFTSSFNIVSPEYRAKLVNKSADQMVKAGKQFSLWAEFKNSGSKNWIGNEGIKLVTDNGRESVFFTNGDWESKGSPGVIDRTAVNSGDTVRVSFLATAPSVAGNYKERFVLKSSGVNLEGGDGLTVEWNFQVGESEGQLTSSSNERTYSGLIQDYNFEIVNQSSYLNLTPGGTGNVLIEVKNTGKSTWYKDIFRLATVGPRDRASDFADSTWTGKNRIEMSQYRVDPGQVASFSFTIKSPQKYGSFKEYFGFVAEGVGWLHDIGIYWSFNNNAPSYTSQFNEGKTAFDLIAGSSQPITWKIKNTSNQTWTKSSVRLGTSGPQDRVSSFADSTWLGNNRIQFSENTVAPGDVATFSFTLNTNKPAGAYKEKFRLVFEGVAWFNEDLELNLTIGGEKDDFDYVGQSAYSTVNRGEVKQVWLEVKNVGTRIWKRDGDGPIRLATSNPRDRSSKFIAANRVYMDRDTVNPGETVRFTFNVTAPYEPGVYKEYFTLVREGVSWFKDIGIYWEFNVLGSSEQSTVNQNPTSPTGNVETIEDSKKVKVSGSGSFIIVNESDSKIAEGGAGDQVEVFYKNGKNYLNFRNQQYTTSGWFRVVPWAPNTILKVDSYSDRPAWNQAINDNTFKGVIEVRYSTANKKLWVVNDVNLEDYLKGVSEPLEAGAFEYIKAAVIAERSYILNHLNKGGRWPADNITLKNSRNGNGDDQIYQGYGFTQRATNIPSAVEATKGEVVTYNGSLVLTPYYTQSDGRTRNISEVWGSKQSDYPWLVSVPDPWSAGQPMLGHGVGMSGRGARGMGAEGKGYKEILKYFYTGTDVSKVDTNRNVRVGIYAIDI